MDTRNGKELFNEPTIKQSVHSKLEKSFKEIRANALRATEGLSLDTKSAIRAHIDTEIRLIEQEIESENKKKGNNKNLPPYIKKYSSIWLPVCVNYPKQEYSKQQYLELMLYAMETYGKEKVEMTLFPNRYIRNSADGQLFSEDDSIKASIEKWNLEEPQGVQIDENGQLIIKDERYNNLAGKIFDGSKHKPEGYDDISIQLKEYCDSTSKKYKKGLDQALEKDLNFAVEKFSLSQDVETNAKLSKEHILRETAYVLAKMDRIQKFNFDENTKIDDISIDLPNICVLAYYHELFKLMEATIKQAFMFGRDPNSLGVTKFKRMTKENIVGEKNKNAQADVSRASGDSGSINNHDSIAASGPLKRASEESLGSTSDSSSSSNTPTGNSPDTSLLLIEKYAGGVENSPAKSSRADKNLLETNKPVNKSKIKVLDQKNMPSEKNSLSVESVGGRSSSAPEIPLFGDSDANQNGHKVDVERPRGKSDTAVKSSSSKRFQLNLSQSADSYPGILTGASSSGSSTSSSGSSTPTGSPVSDSFPFKGELLENTENKKLPTKPQAVDQPDMPAQVGGAAKLNLPAVTSVTSVSIFAAASIQQPANKQPSALNEIKNSSLEAVTSTMSLGAAKVIEQLSNTSVLDESKMKDLFTLFSRSLVGVAYERVEATLGIKQ